MGHGSTIVLKSIGGAKFTKKRPKGSVIRLTETHVALSGVSGKAGVLNKTPNIILLLFEKIVVGKGNFPDFVFRRIQAKHNYTFNPPMQSYFLQRQLNRIEREAKYYLLQLHCLGADHFPTPELHDLLDRLYEQRQVVAQKLKRQYRFGACAPLLFLIALLAGYFGFRMLGIIALSGVPVLLALYILRTYRLRRDHPTYFRSQDIEKAIRQELRRRAGSSIS